MSFIDWGEFRVKMLNYFEPSTLQLGDKSFYNFQTSDALMSLKDWHQLQKSTLFPDADAKCRKVNGIKTSETNDEWESEASEDVETSSNDHASESESYTSGRGSQGISSAADVYSGIFFFSFPHTSGLVQVDRKP